MLNKILVQYYTKHYHSTINYYHQQNTVRQNITFEILNRIIVVNN